MYKDHFELLNRYRHYPKFQLERHIDTFIGVWLPTILEMKYKTKYTNVIPEFPIPKQLLSDNYVYNDARSMDFILFSEDKKQVILIELKTDIRSINQNQELDYERLNGRKFEDVILKLYEIVKASKKSRYKYLLLIKDLYELGFIKVAPEFFSDYKERKIVNAEKYLLNNTIFTNAKCRVVYILPRKVGEARENCIYFEEIVANENIDADLRSYLDMWIKPVSHTVSGKRSIKPVLHPMQ